MKEELGTAGAVVGMMVLACLFGGLALAVYPGWATVGVFLSENLLLTKEAPAWVQAVGSIAAIVGSLWVARYQLQKQAERDVAAAREMRWRKRQAFLMHLRYACGISDKIRTFTTGGSNVNGAVAVTMRIEVAGANAQFVRLDAGEFADSQVLIEALGVAIASTQALVVELDGYVRGIEFGYESLSSLHDMSTYVVQHLHKCSIAVEMDLRNQTEHSFLD